MSTAEAPRPATLGPPETVDGPAGLRLRSTFESFYRAHVGLVSRYFVHRLADPQVVADLTSETFVRAMASAHTFAGRGSETAWVFAIARAVYAQYQAEQIDGRSTVSRLSGRVVLQEDQLESLVEQIDAERHVRDLLSQAGALRDAERLALELVDMGGLSPQQAARVLGISPGNLRVRLFRARSQLRKGEIKR